MQQRLDPTGFGEGGTFVFAQSVSHPGGGARPFSATFVAVANAKITATATEMTGAATDGSTSEFSRANVAPTIDLDSDNSSSATTADFATTFTEDNGPVLIADSDAIVNDVDSTTLASLQVSLVNPLNGAAEILAADTSGTSIAATYNSGLLSLTGVDTLANYQQVLRTITYNNTSQDPDTTPRTIQFVANDGANGSNMATATVAINAINDPPQAVADNYEVDNNQSLSVISPGLLVNDTDVDDAVLTVVLVSGPSSGTLELNSDGSFLHHPDINFSGTTSFVYQAADATTTSTAVSVTITVIATAAPPPDVEPAPGPAPEDPNADDPDKVEDIPDDDDDTPANDELPTNEDPVLGNPDGGHRTEQDKPPPTLRPIDSAPGRLLVVDNPGPVVSDSNQPLARLRRILAVSADRRQIPNGLLLNTATGPIAAYDQVLNTYLWQQLDAMQEDLEGEDSLAEFAVGTATVVTAALSTGYTLWTLRGSFLVASLLSTLPAWRDVDPLPVLDQHEEEADLSKAKKLPREDNESLADIASSLKEEQDEPVEPEKPLT